MKISPLEVQQKTFRTVRLGGVDPKEVDHYLDAVSREMEDLVRETHKLQETIRKQETSLKEHTEREALLQSTLTTAQKVMEEVKGQARKQAELLLADAELQAEKIIATAQAKRLALMQDIEELKRGKAVFFAQLSAAVEGHKAMLDAMRASEQQQPQQSAPPPPAQPKAPQHSESESNVSFLAPPTKRADAK